jgi:hypothetical protein
MNLSHAVAAVLAEIFSRRCGLLDPPSAEEVQRAAGALNGDVDEARLLQLQTSSSSKSNPSINGGAVVIGGGREPRASELAATAAAVATGGYRTGQPAQSGSAGAGTAQGAVPASGDAGLLPASAQEMDLLLRKVAAVAEAVGMSGEDSKGGGNAGESRDPTVFWKGVRRKLQKGCRRGWRV